MIKALHKYQLLYFTFTGKYTNHEARSAFSRSKMLLKEKATPIKCWTYIKTMQRRQKRADSGTVLCVVKRKLPDTQPPDTEHFMGVTHFVNAEEAF